MGGSQKLSIPVHNNCKYRIESVTAIVAGTATAAGENGIDYYVTLYGVLPNNYVTKENAKDAGWIAILGNLQDVLPESIIGGDIYYNRDKRLPEAVGRIWYEADFDYDGGLRNGCRLLYSNDGLLFITYDHYLTFNEIGLEYVK